MKEGEGGVGGNHCVGSVNMETTAMGVGGRTPPFPFCSPYFRSTHQSQNHKFQKGKKKCPGPPTDHKLVERRVGGGPLDRAPVGVRDLARQARPVCDVHASLDHSPELCRVVVNDCRRYNGGRVASAHTRKKDGNR